MVKHQFTLMSLLPGFPNATPVRIVTWGRQCRKSCPEKTEHNFNAAVIHDRARGVDLRRMTGRDEELQDAFLKSRDFVDFVEVVAFLIVDRGFKTISINCAKGRHRSVAAAEVLKKLYFPNAVVYHHEHR